MDLNNSRDLFYSSPMSLGRKDAEKIREVLVQAVERAVGIMRPSPSEVVRCLNIDWFEY